MRESGEKRKVSDFKDFLKDTKSLNFINSALKEKENYREIREIFECLKDPSNLLAVGNPEIIKEVAINDPNLIIQLKYLKKEKPNTSYLLKNIF